MELGNVRDGCSGRAIFAFCVVARLAPVPLYQKQ